MPEPKKVNEILVIAIEEGTNKIMVKGALGNKKFCLNVLGEAVKIVANFESHPSKIVKPGGIMGFVRRGKK